MSVFTVFGLGAIGLAAQCPSNLSKTVIFFVNGIETDDADAEVSRQTLQNKFLDFLSRASPTDPSLQAACLRFDLAYNNNELWLTDIYEAARQRLGINSSTVWRLIVRHTGILGSALQQAYNAVFLDQIVQLDPNSYVRDADLAKHVKQYSCQIAQGKRVVALGHSQGNLYANMAYSNLFNGPNPLQTNSFGIVAVATPASFVAGATPGQEPYTTLLEDLVILAIELGLPSTLDWNASNGGLASSKDPLGHSFIDAYLAGSSSDSEVHIMLTMIGVISGLEAPPSNDRYCFGLDTFRIVRNDILYFEDPFNDGVPPPSAPNLASGFTTSYRVGPTGATVGPEVGGKLTIDSSGAVVVPPFGGAGADFLLQETILRTNIDSGDLVRGLKVDDTFSVTGIFDLIHPDPQTESYGIMLTDNALLPGNDQLELLVRRLPSQPVARITFLRRNFITQTISIIASTLVDPSHDQIALTLTRPTTINNRIQASFAYIDGGVMGPVTTFGTTATIFNGENFTRAGFRAISRLPE